MFGGNKRYLNKVFINEQRFFSSKIDELKNDRISSIQPNSNRIYNSFCCIIIECINQTTHCQIQFSLDAHHALYAFKDNYVGSEARLFFCFYRSSLQMTYDGQSSFRELDSKEEQVQICPESNFKKNLSSFVCFSNSPRSFASPSFFFCNKLKSFSLPENVLQLLLPSLKKKADLGDGSTFSSL